MLAPPSGPQKRHVVVDMLQDRLPGLESPIRVVQIIIPYAVFVVLVLAIVRRRERGDEVQDRTLAGEDDRIPEDPGAGGVGRLPAVAVLVEHDRAVSVEVWVLNDRGEEERVVRGRTLYLVALEEVFLTRARVIGAELGRIGVVDEEEVSQEGVVALYGGELVSKIGGDRGVRVGGGPVEVFDLTLIEGSRIGRMVDMQSGRRCGGVRACVFALGTFLVRRNDDEGMRLVMRIDTVPAGMIHTRLSLKMAVRIRGPEVVWMRSIESSKRCVEWYAIVGRQYEMMMAVVPSYGRSFMDA